MPRAESLAGGGRDRWVGCARVRSSSSPDPRGGSGARLPRPAPRRARPGAEAAATRRALLLPRLPSEAQTNPTRRRRWLPRLGAPLTAGSTFDFRDRRATASPTSPPPPTPRRPRPSEQLFSRLRSSQSAPCRAGQPGPAAPLHAPTRPLRPQCQHRRGVETIARGSRRAEAPALPAGSRAVQDGGLRGGRRARRIPG
ncbi:sterile alpha motif domain-containing protein 1-like [Sorex araneus]|uniref:sterile alpha motif domain-containing protein 1-like n=1 Tax=Sorex araneus TaxID=42254 RepID=UPI0024337D1B|nr:sterile alpha motif domain-containing protein 1-like [Sorex araneus]